MKPTALVWLRRDLRLADNPALSHACKQAEHVIPVYIHEPGDAQGSWADGAASRWWLHRSLEALDLRLKSIGGALILRQGSARETLSELMKETGATLVTWNRLYEPAAIERDKQIQAALRQAGVATESFNGALLFEPWEIQTATRTPYRVFTPFWRTCSAALDRLSSALPAPKRIDPPARKPKSLSLAALGLKPRIRWDTGLEQTWTPGEAGALQQLKQFAGETVNGYPDSRNRPGQWGTSRLSPHLHFGEISPRQVLAAFSGYLRGAGAARRKGAEAFIRQIGWREFAHHLLFHYPHTAEQPLDEKFRRYPWSKARTPLRAWQRGLTGYPLVDAGLRELWHTGWMHNRVRMCAASFLTKNLRIHWLEGARWFWDTLVDADLPNNTLGWQWVAGCGADAAPYYRVFNPVLQAEKFDPRREYIRQWIPELAKLPDRWIHRPWEAPQKRLAEAGVKLGREYPQPIVALRKSRDAALEGYQEIKGGRQAGKGRKRR